MREWLSSSHKSPMCVVVSGMLELLRSFLNAWFSTATVNGFSSPPLRCWLRVLHLLRSVASPSQHMSMLTAFMSLMQTYLFIVDGGGRCFYYPIPDHRVEGVFLDATSLRWTWPNHNSLRWLIRGYILGRLAQYRASTLDTLLCHDISRIISCQPWYFLEGNSA